MQCKSLYEYKIIKLNKRCIYTTDVLLKEHHGKGAKSLFLSAVLCENWFIQAQRASADVLQTVTHIYRLVGSCNDQIHDLIRFCQYLSGVTGLLLFLLPQVVSASSTVSLPCSICLFFIHCRDFVKVHQSSHQQS